MKVIEINAVATGSTGKIMLGIADVARKKGFEVITCCGGRKDDKRHIDNHFRFSHWIDFYFHTFVGGMFGIDGFLSFFSTLRLIKKIKSISPDIIHLHIMHGSFVNLPIIFSFLRRVNKPIVWTLHDCWAFTGRCPYFILLNCSQWETGCYSCSYPKNAYPSSKIDNVKKMWKLKKKWFTGIKDLTIVTPSQWLAGLAKQSFLKDYPIQVIHNGIDLSIFQPTESNFREKHNISQDKFILLGVAFYWGKRKGLDVFLELAKRLPNKYQIVLVGTDDNVDKQLPKTIISIHRTQNQTELAEIYTAADLFVNPTREENYPTVNMESIACGVPVLTFETGGSPEIIDETCGSVVDVDDIDSLEKEIIRICETKPYSKEACLERAKLFDMNDRFKEYIDLYKELSGNQ